MRRMSAVALIMRVSSLVQRRTRARPPEAEQMGEIGRAALGRWCADAARGGLEVCDRWRGLAVNERRGLLVFCEALGMIESWPGLDVEESRRPLTSYKPMTAAIDCPTLSAASSISRSPRWA